MKLTRILTGFFVTAAALFLPVTHGFAAAPMVKTQAPGYHRMMLGDFEITALSDGTAGLPVEDLLKGISNKDVARMLEHNYLESPVETSVNAYLVNTGSKLVLIDTGAGPYFGPTTGKLVKNLKASGYQPHQVDEIYITHMHSDHIGGLADNGQRVFANATLRVEKEDADYWLSAENMANAPPELKPHFEAAQASFKPYIDAGKLKTFTGDTDLVPGIRTMVTQAHTPGHSLYIVESNNERMTVLGDLIHVGAVQFRRPGVSIIFDSDRDAAIKQRRKAFDQVAKDGSVAAGAHLSFPGLGHIRTDGGGRYEWIPLNYESVP